MNDIAYFNKLAIIVPRSKTKHWLNCNRKCNSRITTLSLCINNGHTLKSSSVLLQSWYRLILRMRGLIKIFKYNVLETTRFKKPFQFKLIIKFNVLLEQNVWDCDLMEAKNRLCFMLYFKFTPKTINKLRHIL